jgi:DNA-binding response OmpR family regulator
VYEAEDGDSALSEIIQHAPDLLILDLAMPVLDGMRTLGMLEGVHGQLKPKVIVLTAWGSMPAAMRAIALGAAVFLEKPVLPETLRNVVARVLEQPADQGGVGLGWDQNRD